MTIMAICWYLSTISAALGIAGIAEDTYEELRGLASEHPVEHGAVVTHELLEHALDGVGDDAQLDGAALDLLLGVSARLRKQWLRRERHDAASMLVCVGQLRSSRQSQPAVAIISLILSTVSARSVMRGYSLLMPGKTRLKRFAPALLMPTKGASIALNAVTS